MVVSDNPRMMAPRLFLTDDNPDAVASTPHRTVEPARLWPTRSPEATRNFTTGAWILIDFVNAADTRSYDSPKGGQHSSWEPRMFRVFRGLVATAVTLGFLGAGWVGTPVARTDDSPTAPGPGESADPPSDQPPSGAYAASGGTFHILTTQDLCNLIWPSSEAQPNPMQFGAICVRQGGVLLRLTRDSILFNNTFTLAPGRAPELPKESVRVNPADPMSDWIIPDCSVPDRIDCNPKAPGSRYAGP
jgi:hypothetical protein